jgi:tRNA guanosine-2'-O-methyltransferase
LLQVAASVKVSYITERELTEYLRRMKYQHGYTVIAIEQTDKSVSLADAKFPVNKASPSSEPELTNCIILLGKEKEGIPVEFLSEVDMCIEIPQFGVVRSLNVHVSAALAVWEATKQNVGFRRTLPRTSDI